MPPYHPVGAAAATPTPKHPSRNWRLDGIRPPEGCGIRTRPSLEVAFDQRTQFLFKTVLTEARGVALDRVPVPAKLGEARDARHEPGRRLRREADPRDPIDDGLARAAGIISDDRRAGCLRLEGHEAEFLLARHDHRPGPRVEGAKLVIGDVPEESRRAMGRLAELAGGPA